MENKPTKLRIKVTARMLRCAPIFVCSSVIGICVYTGECKGTETTNSWGQDLLLLLLLIQRAQILVTQFPHL